LNKNKVHFLNFLIFLCIIVSYNLISKPTTKTEKALEKAFEHIQKNELEKAHKVYSDLIKQNPKSRDALISRAEFYIMLEKYNEAIRDYNQLLTFDTLNSVAYYRRAYAKNKGDSIAVAVNDYKKALSMDSSNIDLIFDWALYSLTYDNIQIAIDNLELALIKDSSRTEGYGYLGYAYYRMNEYDKSLENYNKAISYDKKNTQLYFNQANTLLKLDKFDEAINSYTKAIELDPNFEDAYENRSFAYYRIGNLDKAEADKLTIKEVKERKMASYDDNIDLSKSKVFTDSTNQLKIYMPEEFHQTFLSDSEIISMGVTREKIPDIFQGFIVGVIVEKILDPSKTLKISEPSDLIGYLKAYAISTGENAFYSNIITEKQKPLGRYGQGAFYQSIFKRF